MYRTAQSIVLFAMALGSLNLSAQNPDPLQSLVGKEVVVKIDMPGPPSKASICASTKTTL